MTDAVDRETAIGFHKPDEQGAEKKHPLPRVAIRDPPQAAVELD